MFVEIFFDDAFVLTNYSLEKPVWKNTLNFSDKYPTGKLLN